MKRWALLFMVLAILFSACQMVNVEEEINNALTSLESGDISSAEESFSRVLQADPENPTANAGMAVVEFVRGYFRAYSLYENTSQEIENELDSLERAALGKFIEKVLPQAKIISEEEFDLSEIIQEISDFQEEIENELIPVYESAYNYASKALEGEFESIRIYPNRLDVDGDGKIESNTPLKFRTSYGTTFTIEDVYRCIVPYISNGEIIFIDKDGGDAWFDLGRIIDGGCGDPTFDENDYIEVDRGEMFFIKAFSAAMLSYMNTVVTYKFDMPEDTIYAINQAVNNQEQSLLLTFFDADGNGTITNAEFNARLSGFLEFRSTQERLRNVLLYAKEFLENAIDLDEEIENDESDTHNITSPAYFEDGILSDEEREMFSKLIDYLTDTPIPYSETNFATINLFVLKDHTERFQDLKNFFPDWNYNTSCYSFPDPSFGGLIESDWDGNFCQ